MMRPGLPCFLPLLGLLLLPGAVRAEPAGATQDPVTFFETKVRPVLADHCYKCHSSKSEKLKARLVLDSRAGLLKGGESGPAIVPGHPEQSRLVDAIGYRNVDLQMPPKARLSDGQIADLTQWVRLGAPWPAEAARPTVAPENAEGAGFDLAARKAAHWSWRAVKAAAPPAVKQAGWARGAIDAF